MSYKPKIIGTFDCPHCKKEDAEVYWEDVGIGSYEFWGAKGCDTRIEYFCAECDEPADGFEPEPDYPDEDPFRDDVEADADTLKSAGYGTDEDYGGPHDE